MTSAPYCIRVRVSGRRYRCERNKTGKWGRVGRKAGNRWARREQQRRASEETRHKSQET